VPTGYLGELRGKREVDDLNVEEYLQKLRLVTEGDLWTWPRWKAIFDLNLGSAHHLLDDYWRVHSHTQIVPASAVASPLPDGWDCSLGCVAFSDYGISVRLPGVSHAPGVKLSLVNSEPYLVEGRQQGELIWKDYLPLGPEPADRLHVHRIAIKAGAASLGYDEVIIKPKVGEDEYALGQLRVLERLTPDSP